MKRNKLIVIFGPTATGKTKLAARLASEFNGEIISADSRQVYRGMNIGTGKDYDDYVVQGKKIPYHLIDIAEPEEEFNLARFIEEFNFAYEKVAGRGKVPFLVGGTMLFIHAILKRYKLKKIDFNKKEIEKYENFSVEQLREKLLSRNPQLHNTTDLSDKERIIKALILAEANSAAEIEPIKTETLNLCVLPERGEIYNAIDKRLEQRLSEGMIEEVRQLLENGLPKSKLDFFGLEYRFIGEYLAGNLNYNDMKQKLASAIKKFAKRQITWIRKFEKEGFPIVYITKNNYDEAELEIKRFLHEDN